MEQTELNRLNCTSWVCGVNAFVICVIQKNVHRALRCQHCGRLSILLWKTINNCTKNSTSALTKRSEIKMWENRNCTDIVHLTIKYSTKTKRQLLYTTRLWRQRPSCKLETGSRQDKTQFTPHFETDETAKHVQFEIFCRRQPWLVAITVRTADTDKTRQDKTRQDETVLSCLVGTRQLLSVN